MVPLTKETMNGGEQRLHAELLAFFRRLFQKMFRKQRIIGSYVISGDENPVASMKISVREIDRCLKE
jgi:hypothetical protein